jgi:hypothetical protein
MKKSLSFLYLLLSGCILLSQDMNRIKWHVGADLGIASYVFSDKILNYYQYDATTFLPINIHCYYPGEKNIHFLTLNYKRKTLTLSQESINYQFNNIDFQEINFNYEYYHRILIFRTNLSLFLGASYNLHGSIFDEQYKSILWPFQVSQFSFDVSQNLLIKTLLKFQIRNNSFIVKTGFAVLNYGTRPDDYFVKYGGSYYHSKWHSINNYQDIVFSFMYHYDISGHFSMRLEYLNEYRTYKKDYEFKFLEQFWFGGVSYKL